MILTAENNEIKAPIDVYVLQNGIVEKDLSFSWSVIDLSETEMVISLEFKNPGSVSSQVQKDTLVIKSNYPELFKGEGQQLLNCTFHIEK